jgi:diadenylate cyclase
LITSLVVATLFYTTLIVSQAEIMEKIVTVPVEYTASPPDLILIGDKNKEVRVHLSGQRSDMDLVQAGQVQVKIDLAKTVEGRQTFLIAEDNIKLPEGVTLIDVIPQSIELELARIVEHEIPIRPQLVGKLPREYRLRSLELLPDKIRVFSPERPKKGAGTYITTTPIYLEGITEDTDIFCKIIAPPSVQPVDKRWPDVQVRINVEKK